MQSHFAQQTASPQTDSSQLGAVPSAFRVERVREHQQVVEWLKTHPVNTQILCVAGIAGIGKTTLMMDMASRAREARARVLWLDCRTNARLPVDFLTSLDVALQMEYGVFRDPDTPLLSHIANVLSNQKSLLFMDNCEEIDLIESWLLSSFLPRLDPHDILLVIASRSGLPVKWLTNPDWRSRIDTFQLDVFSEQELRAYLQPYALSNQNVERIAQQTKGHPLSVALAVESIQLRDRDASGVADLISGVISAEVLKEVTNASLHDALQALSFLPIANQTELAKLTQRPLQLSEYHALARLSFINSSPRGLSLHEVVKQLLRQDLQQRDPATCVKLCKDTIRLLAEQYPSVHSAEQVQIASHVLQLYLWLMPTRHSYADFSSHPKIGPHQPFRNDDLPRLHRFLEDSLQAGTWQCELIAKGQHHTLLDALAEHCPEGIRVVRSETGIPLCFSASLWLHEDTWPVLDTYTTAKVSDALREEETDLRRLPREFMDSILVLLTAVDIHHPIYQPEELGVLSFEDWFTFLGVGSRSIVISGDPLLNSLLLMFGCQELRYVDHSPNKLLVSQLDFRNAKFPLWVQSMLQELDEQNSAITIQFSEGGPENLAGHNPENRGDSVVNQGVSDNEGTLKQISVQDMEKMLRSLQDSGALEQTRCAQQLELSGLELQHRIQSLLTMETPAFPLTSLYQAILRESFLVDDVGKALLAERFHMSRTTFYRHSRRAMAQLAQAFMRSCHFEKPG